MREIMYRGQAAVQNCWPLDIDIGNDKATLNCIIINNPVFVKLALTKTNLKLNHCTKKCVIYYEPTILLYAYYRLM